MASEIILTLWTDHAADLSLASDLAAEAAKQIFRSTSQQAAVVSATAREVTALLEDAPPAPVVTVEPTPAVVEPQPTNADGTAIPTIDEAAQVAAEHEASARLGVVSSLYESAPPEVQAAAQAATTLPAVEQVLSDFYTPLAGLEPTPAA